MEQRDCPFCGFWAHFVCSVGHVATFRCDRCGRFFKETLA